MVIFFLLFLVFFVLGLINVMFDLVIILKLIMFGVISIVIDLFWMLRLGREISFKYYNIIIR